MVFNEGTTQRLREEYKNMSYEEKFKFQRDWHKFNMEHAMGYLDTIDAMINTSTRILQLL